MKILSRQMRPLRLQDLGCHWYWFRRLLTCIWDLPCWQYQSLYRESLEQGIVLAGKLWCRWWTSLRWTLRYIKRGTFYNRCGRPAGHPEVNRSLNQVLSKKRSMMIRRMLRSAARRRSQILGNEEKSLSIRWLCRLWPCLAQLEWETGNAIYSIW